MVRRPKAPIAFALRGMTADGLTNYVVDPCTSSLNEPSIQDKHEVGLIVTSTDISKDKTCDPVQPILKMFRMTQFGGGKKRKFRAFNSNWYKQFPWLEYSIVRDAAYCYCCRHFLRIAKHGPVKAFITDGFRNWKRATGEDGSLTTHNASHLSCSADLLQILAVFIMAYQHCILAANSFSMSKGFRPWLHIIKQISLTCQLKFTRLNGCFRGERTVFQAEIQILLRWTVLYSF